MRLQIEVPSVLHGDASVHYGAWKRVTAVFPIGMAFVCRVETGVVTLADDDDGDLGWFDLLFSI